MFTPLIDLDVLTRATVLRFSDITGADALTPSTKWDGVSGLNSAGISDAILTVTDPNGNIFTENVKAIIVAAHPIIANEAVALPDIIGEWVDGYYNVEYDIYISGLSTPYYSITVNPFVYANAEMAIERMYAIFAEMKDGIEANDYLKQAEFCNGLLNALMSALTTTSAATVNNIYGRITRILDYNNMDLLYT